MERILVTGANGFIGRALCTTLSAKGYRVLAAVRDAAFPKRAGELDSVCVGAIDRHTDWRTIVKGIDIVIHLAAKVHQLDDKSQNRIDTYREVNVRGTSNLADCAASNRVKRFIYVSSIKVNGNEKPTAYVESDVPMPEDAYGISKMEAENQLKRIASASRLELVVIRPPLVYGPGVKANFLNLMRLVDRHLPLPFANIRNQRSFIFIGNLVDCILKCVAHPKAGGQIYLVSDDRDLSTPELITLIASALDTRCILYPFPQKLLDAAANLFGKGDVVGRLYGSLTADITKIKKDLAWKPPFSAEYGLLQTAKWFKKNKTVV
jgi:nucleoside-diphosphate-sugar epimerase